MKSGTPDSVWRSALPPDRIAVIAALELEARILEDVLGACSFRLLVSGPGPEHAARAAETAIEGGARGLVAWGLAGGLSTAAGTGAVSLPAQIASAAGEWRADPGWRQRLADVLAGRFALVEAALFSSERVLTTAAAKAALAEQTGAVAVDMESAAIARAAAAAGVPCIAVRAIADGPGDDLPDNVAALVTPDGRTRYRGLAGVVVSPRRFTALLRLARCSQGARRTLRDVAATLGAAR